MVRATDSSAGRPCTRAIDLALISLPKALKNTRRAGIDTNNTQLPLCDLAARLANTGLMISTVAFWRNRKILAPPNGGRCRVGSGDDLRSHEGRPCRCQAQRCEA